MTAKDPQAVFDRLLTLGRDNNLGGTGDPVAVVVIYPREAFVKASWADDRDGVVKALMDAMGDEMSKVASDT